MRHEIDITDLLNKLPKEAKRKIIKAIESIIEAESNHEPIDRIRQFVEMYDEDDNVDGFVAKAVANVIDTVGSALHKAIKASKTDGLCGIEAGRIVVERLRYVASYIEKQIEVADEPHDCQHH